MNTQARYELRRGGSSSLPTVINPYEPIYTTDEKEIYVGNADGKPERATRNKEVANLLTTSCRKNTSPLYYYISPTGNDDNDGLSADTPKATIQQLIDSLPKYIAYPIIINIATGIYNEDITITGFNGSRDIKIACEKNTKINSLYIHNCSCNVTINNMEIITTSSQYAGILIENCFFVSLNGCKDEAIQNRTGVWIKHSHAEINTSTFSNKYNAILCSYCSILYSYQNSGSNNSIGLQALYSGFIGKVSTQPEGVTSAEASGNGGMIL